MTIWHSLTYNSRSKTGALINSWALSKIGTFMSGCLRFWKSFSQKMPSSYLSLIVQAQALKILRFTDNQLIEQTSFNLYENNHDLLASYLAKFPSYPLQIIIQGGEIDFRFTSLKKAKWWDRSALLKRIRCSEFTSSDLSQSLRSPSPEDSQRYSVVGIRPSHSLKILLDFFSRQPNPIASIRLWPILAAQEVLKTAKKQLLSESLPGWVFILLCQDELNWQLIVCENEAIALYRQGFIAPESSLNKTLDKEILATLRYLHRNGYKEGEKITLIQTGLTEKIASLASIKKEIIYIPSVISPQASWLTPFKLFSYLCTRLFPSYNSSQANFYSPQLAWQHLAFCLSPLLKSICVPLCTYFLVGGIFFTILQVFQQPNVIQLQKKISDLALSAEKKEQLLTGKLFRYYLTNQPSSPFLFLNPLGKSLTPIGVATEINWQAKTSAQPSSTLTISLMFDERHLKNKQISSIEKYQQKMKNLITNIRPAAQLTWPKVTDTKSLTTLKISY